MSNTTNDRVSTCPRCHFGHPPNLSCTAAAAIAQEDRRKFQNAVDADADDNVQSVVKKMREAADAVMELRDGVDPSHVPLIKYLTAVMRNLRTTACDVEQSYREELGD